MWHFRLWDLQDVAVFVSITIYMCHLAGAISINSSQRTFTRSVQGDVFFSLDFACNGIPTIQWTFMSGAVSRFIGTWQPGGYTNITMDYSSRVQPYSNGSMGLSDLRLQDAGYYVVTIMEEAGSSKDAGFVLKVNGEWIYCDAHGGEISLWALFLLCHQHYLGSRAKRKSSQFTIRSKSLSSPIVTDFGLLTEKAKRPSVGACHRQRKIWASLYNAVAPDTQPR